MTQHLPVLLPEILESFSPREGDRFLDCTFGGGGHTRALLESAQDVTVDAIDQDPAAWPRAEALQASYPGRLNFHAMNFSELAQLEAEGFQGILFDLGVSSFQLDEAERGFSFRKEAAADMRMNPEAGESAARFLETASFEELSRAIRDYGEEKSWRRVTDAIMGARGSGTLATTTGLAALIEETIGSRRGHRGNRIHPATQSFQGIRIAVNDEMGVIERALPHAFEKLALGGVLAVISFHSLEDRLIKRFFNRLAGRPEHGRDSRPQDEREKRGTLLSRKPILPSDEEIKNNARSRSAKLRVIRKEVV